MMDSIEDIEFAAKKKRKPLPEEVRGFLFRMYVSSSRENTVPLEVLHLRESRRQNLYPSYLQS